MVKYHLSNGSLRMSPRKCGQHPSLAVSCYLLVPSCLGETGCEVSLCRAECAGLPRSDRGTCYRPLIFVALRRKNPLPAQHLALQEAPAPLHCSMANRDQEPFYEHASTHPAIIEPLCRSPKMLVSKMGINRISISQL